MTMKPFEIQSPTLSINGVKIDTSAQGKLVVPGVTRAGTSVAIEVEDTGDQTQTWNSAPHIIDGYTYEVNYNSYTAQLGWTAATYAVNQLDGDGYIDGISVTDGGAGYTGEAVTFSEVMYASANGSTNWVQIPYKVRCGAGSIESEFGSGGVSFPLTRDNYNSPNMLQATEGDSNWNIGFYSDEIAAFYTQLGFFGNESNTRGVSILDNDSGNAWIFDGTGNLRLPQGGGIGTAGMGWPGFYSDNGYLSIIGKSNNPDYLGQTESEIFLSNNDNAGYLNINLSNVVSSQSVTWQFTPDGNLSMPGNTVVSTPDGANLRLRTSGLYTGIGASIEHVSDIEGPFPYNTRVKVDKDGAHINTSGDTAVWDFNNDGSLVLTNNGIIRGRDIANEIKFSVEDQFGPHKSGIWFGSDNNDGTQQYVQVVASDSDGRHAEINAWADGPDYNAVEIKADIKTWEFKSDGNIRFPDNTIQTTAYNYSPQPLVNLDGGIASTSFPTNYVYVDGGGSYIRGILQEDIFDGSDNAAGLTEFDKVLNGGGA